MLPNIRRSLNAVPNRYVNILRPAMMENMDAKNKEASNPVDD